MRNTILVLAIVAALAAGSVSAQTVGDADKGKDDFAGCAVCHSATPGKNGIGPSLFGVVGRRAGTEAGFNYSDAMKNAGVWAPKKLDAFITAPKTAVPGTVMPYMGMKDSTKRANIIAYLSTLK